MTVSVTIPTYNRASLLKAALDSVLRQTYRDLEIIVIDDGSTDETPAVVAAYGDQVRYVRQANGGLGAARNTGLALSTGEYVTFLDSDDEWFEFKIALQVALLEAMPTVDYLFTEFTVLHADGRRTSRGSRTWLADPTLDWAALYPQQCTGSSLGVGLAGVPDFNVYWGGIYRQLLHEALVLPTTAIVRRRAIGTLRLTERMTIFEDWEFFARLGRNHDAAFVDLDMALNRSHNEPGRLTRCSTLRKAESYLEMFDRVWKSDAAFSVAHPEDVRRAESAALLAIAREALLDSRYDVAQCALARWRQSGATGDRTRGTAYRILASIPGGRQLLRGGIISRNVVKRVATGRHVHYPVNPGA